MATAKPRLIVQNAAGEREASRKAHLPLKPAKMPAAK
jgi:hypothetical protein